MIEIDVNIDTAALDAAVSRLRELAADTSPLMRRCAGVLESEAEDAFDEQADPVTGSHWAPLAASTQLSRTLSGHAGKILQLTGSLAASLSRDSGRDYAVVGTNKVYAAIHQFGGTTSAHIIRARYKKALGIPGIGPRKSVRHPGSTIPARPFLGLGQEGADDILDIFQTAVQRALFG